MNRTELDEKSFRSYLFNPSEYTDEELSKLMGEGFNYSSSDGCWRWIRENVSENSFNSLNCKQLTEHQKMWLSYQQIPGTSSNPLSQNAYNVFAKWNQWFGGYVSQLGFVGAPASSAYGAAMYINGSWVYPGTSGFPTTSGDFYRMVGEGKWTGGYVETFGYVSQETRILGASSGLGFIGTSVDSLRPLVPIANICRVIDSDPVMVYTLEEVFSNFWNQSKNEYEIPAWAITDYLTSKYTAASVKTIHEALNSHYGVMVRIVTRTETVNGKVCKYGNDSLIVGYNPILQQFSVVNSYGKVNTVSVETFAMANETIQFVYKKRFS